MAITQSAKKAIRSSARKRLFNLRRRFAIAKVTKQIKKLVADGRVEEARKLVPLAYKALDKAVKTRFLKKNAAARRKSRLMAFIKRASSQKVA